MLDWICVKVDDYYLVFLNKNNFNNARHLFTTIEINYLYFYINIVFFLNNLSAINALLFIISKYFEFLLFINKILNRKYLIIYLKFHKVQFLKLCSKIKML